MVTKEMERVYQAVADLLMEMIPEKWREIFLYAELSEGAQTVFFYYYPDKKNEAVYSLDLVNLFHLDEERLNAIEAELYKTFTRLHEAFGNAGQKLWTNLTFMLNHEGQLKIKFDYDDKTVRDPLEKMKKWEEEHLQSQLAK